MIKLDSSENLKLGKNMRLNITDFFIQLIASYTFFMTFIFPIITVLAIIFSIGFTIIHFKETGLLGMLHFFSVSIGLCYICINLIIIYNSYISKYRFRDAGIFDYMWIIYLIVNLCLFNLIPLMVIFQGEEYIDLIIFARYTIYFGFPIWVILNILLFFKRSKIKEIE